MRFIRLPAAVAVGALLVTAVPAVGSAPAGAGGISSSPPTVAAPVWTPCFEVEGMATGTVFECTRLAVPLDYDRPQGASIELDLVRIPAGDPERRVGSILLNPGGPGGSGVDFAVGFGPFVGPVLGSEVAARFDIVGFDPRGIARSTPIRCFDTFEEALAIFPSVAFPLTRAEEREFRTADRTLARACRTDREARRLGPHLSTANVARDMDVIRTALGDEELNFLGLSYGTFLGATYANLFPDRVRSVVVDGVLDPIAWVNEERAVPFSTRLRSDEGAQETLEEFFVQCEAAAPGNCALAPNAAPRYAAVADGLLETPVDVVDPGGLTFTVRYQDLISQSLGSLYNPFGYADLARFVVAIESAQAGAPTPASRSLTDLDARFAPRRVDREDYPNVVEGFPAVACTDTRNPRSYRIWREQGAAADAEFGFFGRIWTWASSPCARWPFRDRDRYAGPFDANTANPVLVVGNLYDPATRYEGAQTLRSLLPNSALLTVDAPGHTSLGLSACAGFATGQYLLDPSFATVVDGATCPAEYNAFDIVAAPPTPTDASPEADQPESETSSSDDPSVLIDIRDEINDLIGVLPNS